MSHHLGRAASPRAGRREAWQRLVRFVARRAVRRTLFIAATLLGAGLLFHSLARYSPAELWQAIAAIPAVHLAAALGFAAASYVCLTFFDLLALRSVGSRLSYRRAALASFVSLSIGHNIGFAGLSSGAIRYRFYGRWGMSAGEVARMVLFCGITVTLGLATLAGIALLLDPGTAAQMLPLSRGQMAGAAAACLALPALYLLLAALPAHVVPRQLMGLRRPPLGLAAAQLLVGTVNFACVAACLHQVVRHVAEASFPAVASAYVAANTATLITHVPGGVGVVEAVVQHLLPSTHLIGALLVFRFVYFLLPLALGLALLGVSETRQHRRRGSI